MTGARIVADAYMPRQKLDKTPAANALGHSRRRDMRRVSSIVPTFVRTTFKKAEK